MIEKEFQVSELEVVGLCWTQTLSMNNIVYCHHFFLLYGLPVSMKKTGGGKCSGTWIIWQKEEIFYVLKFSCRVKRNDCSSIMYDNLRLFPRINWL
jgi:hypothetical protein